MENQPKALNAQGKVAVLTAIEKLTKSKLKEARAEADKEMYDLYEGFGTDRAKILLAGNEVGTISLRFSSDAYQVTDRQAFEEFCLLNGLADERKSIRANYLPEVIRQVEQDMPAAIETEFALKKDSEKLFEPMGDAFVLAGTNEVIPGIEPAAKMPIGTTLRGCEPKKVLPALQTLPGAIDALLLGGGANA